MKQMSNEQEIFVPRITQLDANEFDQEIFLLLKNNLLEIAKYFRPGILNNIKPEIDLLINLLIFKYSLSKDKSTFGQKLFNIQYSERLSSPKAFCYIILNYIIPYIKKKHDEDLYNYSNYKIKNFFNKTEVFIKTLQHLNLLLFLRQGIFSTLIDRILSLKVVPKTKLNRIVGYNYMASELIWHGFMEMLVSALPLINFHYIKRKMLSIIPRKSNQNQSIREFVYNVDTKCKICEELPIYPCRISVYCEHIACYYCIKVNLLADKEYICSCGAKNTVDAHLQVLGD